MTEAELDMAEAKRIEDMLIEKEKQEAKAAAEKKLKEEEARKKQDEMLA